MKKREGRRRLAAAALALTAAVWCAVPAVAASPAPLRGALDRSFGDSGRVISDLGPGFVSSRFTGLVRQPDGKLVLSGGIDLFKGIVERRQPDGSLDPEFGQGGIVQVAKTSSLRGLELDPEGRIVVGVGSGSACGGGTVRRLLPTGELDRSFGKDGLSDPVAVSVRGIALDAAGRVLVAGPVPVSACGKNIPPFDVGVARLAADGHVDRSFGEEGVVRLERTSESQTYAADVAVRPDGTILVAGNQSLFALAEDGKPAPGFGTDGAVAAAGSPKLVLALADGGALTAGSKGNSDFEACCRSAGDYLISRYRPDGSLDPAFGVGGTAALDVGEVDDPRALALAPDGDVLMTGTSEEDKCAGACSPIAVLARFERSGALDSGFGSGGWAQLPSTGEPGSYGFDPSLPGLAVAPGGQILAAGGGGGYADAFLLARGPGGAPDAGFGGGGMVTEPVAHPSGTRATGVAIAAGKILVSATSNTGAHFERGIILPSPPSGGFGQGFARADHIGSLWAGEGGYVYSLGGNRVSRFDGNGRPDLGYGSEGAARLPRGFHPIALEAGSGSRVLLAGRVEDRPGLAAVELDASGQPAASFGRRGLALVRFGRRAESEARSLTIDSSGRTVLLGRSGSRSVAARLLPDGRLDRRFGDRGRLRGLPFAGGSESAVTAQPSGGILLSARSAGRGAPLLILRLTAAGSRDRSFGRGGSVRVDTPAPSLSLFATRRQILLVSALWKGGAGGVVLRAFAPDGTADRSFGHRGAAVYTEGPRRFFRPAAAALTTTGRIVVAATKGKVSGGADVELLRFR
jgi:uncharacterized delta-60 repeat protein